MNDKAFCLLQEGADIWEVAVVYSTRWITYTIIWGIEPPPRDYTIHLCVVSLIWTKSLLALLNDFMQTSILCDRFEQLI